MTDLTRRAVHSVGKHFVTLSCVQYPPNSPDKVLVFSGLVVDVSGEWFYVTAGHILSCIGDALASGSSFDIWRLDDQTAGDRFNGKAVPYGFELAEWLVLRDEEIGLDYAAVHLSDFYRPQLEAGGVAAIPRTAWGDYVTNPNHWMLVGIPSESVSYDGETIITARVVASPLVPAKEPDQAGKKSENQFYAQPLDGSERFFEDADGMSGGPVFALRQIEEQWKYWVIGVQSAWYRSSKTLVICPFSAFGYALEEAAKARIVE